jgi:4-hydroxymandelate oxidase
VTAPPVDLGAIVSLPDFEHHARQLMPHMAYEYAASGAADEHSVRWNRERFDSIRLRPRVLVDVTSVDTRVTLLGTEHAYPILLAPVGYQGTMHAEGETGSVRGAGATGTTMIVSTATTTSVEDLAKAATAPLWFQLYVQSDREFTREIVQRAENAGCTALCLTVDTPTLGPRDRQLKAQFSMPPGLTTPHVRDRTTGSGGVIIPERVSLTWEAVDWLRSVARVPVLLKGILDPGDAELAIQHGAAGIIVSNHGARNLDTVPATIDALPAVAERVAGRIPVLLDGGIRRGTDIIKSIALGASAVLIGRPYCYGLGVAGAAGVQRVIELLREELVMAMKLMGRPTLGSIDRSAFWD